MSDPLPGLEPSAGLLTFSRIGFEDHTNIPVPLVEPWKEIAEFTGIKAD